MYIDILEGRITVAEPRILTEFAVRTSLDADRLAAQLREVDQGAWGELSADGYVWVSREAIERAVGADDPEWIEGFAGMVAFARSHGWVSEDGARIRAHVETAA